MKKAVLLIVLLLWLFNASGQTNELQNAYAKKYQALQEKDTAALLQHSLEVIELLDANFPQKDENYVAYTNDLATGYMMVGAFNESVQWYKETISVYTNIYDENHQYVAIIEYNLGGVYHQLRAYDDAETMYYSAYNKLLQSLGYQHEYTQLPIQSLKALYEEIEDSKKSLELTRLIAKYTKETIGENTLDYVIEINNVAMQEADQGLYNEAFEHYKEALKILHPIEGSSENYDAIIQNLTSLFHSYGDNMSDSQLNYYMSTLSGLPEFEFESESYANISHNLGLGFLEKGRYQRALLPLLTFENYLIKNEKEKTYEYVVLCSNLGETYRNLTEYQNAEKFFLKAQRLIPEVESSPEDEVLANNNLGLLYKEMGQYKLGLTYLEKALELSSEQKNKHQDLKESIYNNMGLVYMAEGLYEIAEEMFQQSIKLEKYVSEGEHSVVLNNLGLLYYYMGGYSRAMRYFEPSLELKEKFYGVQHPNYATTLLNIANVHSSKGDYLKARSLYSSSYQIYSYQLGYFDEKIANNLHNLGEMYLQMGQYEKAAEFYNAGLVIRDSVLGPDHPKYAVSLNGMAISYRYLGYIQQAETNYLQCIEIRKKALGTSHPDYIISLMNLAELYEVTDRVTKADSLMNTLNNYFKEQGAKDYLYATFLNNYGGVLLELGKCKEAIELYKESVKLRASIYGKSHQLYGEALGNLGVAYVCIGELEKADEVYTESNKICLQQIKDKYPYLSEQDKALFLGTVDFQFEGYNGFAIRKAEKDPGVWAKVFDNQLQFKGLLLNETKKLKQEILQSKDSVVIQQYENWVAQKEYLAHLYSLDEYSLQARNIDLSYQEVVANDMESDLSIASAAFSDQKRKQTLTWKSIQSTLAPNEAAIELIRTELFDEGKWQDSVLYIALIITNQSKFPEAVILNNGKFLESKGILTYRSLIKFKSEDNASYDQFWSPIQEKLIEHGNIQKVYLSKDGVYHQINVGGLKNPSSGDYLLEELEVSVVSSSRQLINKQISSDNWLTTSSNAYLFGYPDYDAEPEGLVAIDSILSDEKRSRSFNMKVAELPGTKDEVEKINQLLQSKKIPTKMYIGQDANEPNLKSVVGPTILHIATHGFFLPNAGIQKKIGVIGGATGSKLTKSGLVMASSNFINDQSRLTSHQDGIMTAYEASNMNLIGTELVVLSACETGLGDIENGEGVYGLQRAFESAGASAVVMSLWKVSDQATSELMSLFYKNLVSMPNRREAFREAQLTLKKKYPDPFYWAAFVFMGV